jgi:hypothetical protein
MFTLSREGLRPSPATRFLRLSFYETFHRLCYDKA